PAFTLTARRFVSRCTRRPYGRFSGIVSVSASVYSSSTLVVAEGRLRRSATGLILRSAVDRDHAPRFNSPTSPSRVWHTEKCSRRALPLQHPGWRRFVVKRRRLISVIMRDYLHASRIEQDVRSLRYFGPFHSAEIDSAIVVRVGPKEAQHPCRPSIRIKDRVGRNHIRNLPFDPAD